MEALIYLDTHAVVWLYAKELTRFTRVGLDSLEANELLISPMVLLELEYLHETSRIQIRSRTICDSLEQTLGLHVCEGSFAPVVRLASNSLGPGIRLIGSSWLRRNWRMPHC